jgi:hypothetical protein
MLPNLRREDQQLSEMLQAAQLTRCHCKQQQACDVLFYGTFALFAPYQMLQTACAPENIRISDTGQSTRTSPPRFNVQKFHNKMNKSRKEISPFPFFWRLLKH